MLNERARCAAAVLLLVGGGCGTVEEEAPDSGTQGGSDARASDNDAAASADGAPGSDAGEELCAPNSVCIEEPPEEWSGPVALFEGDADAETPDCPSEYGATAVELSGSLDGGTAACECSCGEASGVSCGDAVLSVHASSDLSCSIGGGSTQSLPDGQCQELEVGGDRLFLSVTDVSGGSCEESLEETIPEPTFETQVRACEPVGSFDPEGCEGSELCALEPPEPYDGRICIYTEGDVTCPADTTFEEKIVRYASFVDERACSDCTCGDPTGSCGGGAQFTRSSDGSICDPDFLEGSISAGSCVEGDTTGLASDVTYSSDPEASCEESDSQVEGELAPAEPTTFCCATL